ncbi:hypothetical protein [Silvibacterium sp.]|uniref:hypothetical protein n=1 Tax=Silvibacterium sp. TaxID=1964179 RepID=UPI0039E21940
MTSKVEKFGDSDLSQLRNELLDAGLDSFQAAQVLAAFLSIRGYGIGTEQARDTVLRLENSNCTLDCMQQELERVALVM